MRRTELQLQPVSVECMISAERLPQGHQGDPVSVENLQPDMVLVSHSLKRIGLLDLCSPFDSQSAACWSSQAQTLHLRTSGGGAAGICGRRVAGEDPTMGGGCPRHDRC